MPLVAIYIISDREDIGCMLAELKNRGIKIALATSKPYEFSIKILRHFDLYQYFDFFGAATMDGKISKKEDVIAKLLEDIGAEDKTKLLMIGDRYHDIEGARANGLDKATRTKCIVAFCKTIENAGRKAGVYASEIERSDSSTE